MDIKSFNMIPFRKIIKCAFILITLLISFDVFAGEIDKNYHSALLCKNDSCTTTSRINFLTDKGRKIQITDGGITGDAWSEEFGWINLDPDKAGVFNNGAGHLYGYAWGENTGWINFNPQNGGGVSINNGEFSGWAWSQNHGWIKFDCSVVGACVKTDWSPTVNNSGNSGDITVEDEDVCPNISGIQLFVPSGLYINDGGDCVEEVVPDICDINPNDPSCQNQNPPDFCTLYPNDPSCTGAGNSTCTNCGGGGDDNSSDLPQEEIIPSPLLDIVPIEGKKEKPSPLLNKIFPNSNGVVNFVEKISASPTGKIVTEVTSTTGVAAGLYFNLINAIFSNSVTISEILLLPIRFWGIILTALGIRKRRLPWGTVYDSVTKQPLDPAYVTLQNMEGKEVATSITDLDGRYGFLVPKGQYRIIVNKTNYEFPSRKLAGKTEDELYRELYFSEPIEIKEDGEIINKNIPMDPLKFDWNEFAKKDKKLMKFFSVKQLWLMKISNFIFYLGFLVTIIATLMSSAVYNIIILAVYVLMLVLKKTVLKPRVFGHIKEKLTKNPLPFAIIRIFFVGSDHEVLHKVADKAGRYYCLIPNGTYYAKIENKNADESYSLVYISDPIEVKRGYINKEFEI